MDIRGSLGEQYHAGLDMLRQCVEQCPDDMWTAGTHPRTFWRIAFHTVYFTHLYLGQNDSAYQPWPGRRQDFPELWVRPWSLEPYEMPEAAAFSSKREILDYIAYVDGLVDPTVDSLDLETKESGFRWYKSISKLSHQILNIRHIQGHVGQLSELLMMRDIDIEWTNGTPEMQD